MDPASLLALAGTGVVALGLVARGSVHLLNRWQEHADAARQGRAMSYDRAGCTETAPWRYHDAQGRAMSSLPVVEYYDTYSVD